MDRRATKSVLVALILLTAAAARPQSLHDLAAGKDGPSTSAQVKTCRAAVGKLAATLNQRLYEAVATQGAAGALRFCSLEAVPLTQRISLEEGVAIGRTGLKVRNPHNEPDAWERTTLEQFASRLARGEPGENLEAWTVLEDSLGHHTFRYMKAIIARPLCMKCHGARLRPDVAARLAELYPGDRATGYHVGDLRGAFTVTKPLD